MDEQFVLCLCVGHDWPSLIIWVKTGGYVLEELSAPAATVSSNVGY